MTRANQMLALLFLLIFFAMVWLPLGQSAFLVEHWMKVGTYIAPLLLFLAFKGRAGSDKPLFADVSFMAMVFAAAYMVHQFEEHWIDLLGREYPLYDQLNALVASLYGQERYGIMTPTVLFYINTGTVWALALTAIYASPGHIFPAIAMAGIMLVNGAAHIISAILNLDYNSGLATSIILFLPLGLAFYSALLASGQARLSMLIAGIAFGVLGHVALFAGLFAAAIYEIIPLSIYYGILILMGLSPVLFFRPKHS